MFENNKLYNEDIVFAGSGIDWHELAGKTILITGASGLIGTFLIDVLMYRNLKFNDKISIYAISRNREKIISRFGDYINSPFFHFVQQDIQNPVNLDRDIDYIIHGASNTHPAAYAADPVNTILLSVIGTKNILDFAYERKASRVIFLSTVEIYGENRGDVERFTEEYCGYIDCNTLRACYTEGKRAAESLCQAYMHAKKVDVVIARCCRVYGPTMGDEDTKVIAQFIRNAIKKEPVILKSKGGQQYSYCYVADICAALLVLLLKGKNGDAYNISDESGDISLLQIAELLSKYTQKEIIFDVPSSVESAGYSKVTRALLDCGKMRMLGWKPYYTITDGLPRTLDILS